MMDSDESEVSADLVKCFKGHACLQLNSMPTYYKQNEIFCKKCKCIIFYDE